MSNLFRGGLARRMGLAVALLTVGSSAVLAFGPLPGGWKVAEGGKMIRQRASGTQYAIIQNNGPDSILVTAKGSFEIASGEILAGEKVSVVMPKGSTKVKAVDGNIGNGMGSKGTLVWSQKLSVNGQVIDTKPKQ